MKNLISLFLVGAFSVFVLPTYLWAEQKKPVSEPPPMQSFDWLPGGEKELSTVTPGQEPPGQEPYQITLQVKFECLLFDGDCSQFQVLKPTAAQAHFWVTTGGLSKKDTFEGEVIKDGVFTLRPGELTLLKVAYFNHTDKEVKFRGIPHYIEPQNLQAMTVLNCLCLGATYSVPPQSGWYRIIRVGPTYDTPNGSRLVATHVMTSDSLVE